MAMQATATTSPALLIQEGMYTIKVEQLSENTFYPSLMDGDELVWSGALTDDYDTAKAAVVRQYHLNAKDLVADDTRIVKVNPELLLPHSKNKFVYADDEATDELYNQLNTDPDVSPYVSEYIVLEDGTIISGHRRNWVITKQINPESIKAIGSPRIPLVPVIVRKYESEADELDALVKENKYRENKSRDAILNEAAVLLQVEYLRARDRKARAKKTGEKVAKEEQGRSIRIVAEKVGIGATDLQNQLSLNTFLDERVTNRDLVKLWKKVRDQSTNGAVELRQIWQRDKEREQLTDRHFMRACELMLEAGKAKLKASNAIALAKREIAEEERKAAETSNSNGGKTNKAASSTSTTAKGKTSTTTGGAAPSSPDSEGGAIADGGAGDSTEDDEDTDTQLQAELDAIAHPDSKQRWQEASEAQREIWRKAKSARDTYHDDPANNRLSKRAELVDRCLQVINRTEFDFDPFADLTAPDHIPNLNHYTVLDNFLKKEGGKYINKIEGDVYANILWNQQRDCVQALNQWIESGDVKRLFIVSQSSILNLPTCQEIIKKHGFVVAEWSGRLEYEAGEILTYNCYFPKEGEPKKVSEGNQRYDTAVLFYSKDAEDKLRFEQVFNEVALVTFQREMVATAALDSSEYLKLPVWVANECHWQGYKLRIELDAEGVWVTYFSEDKEGSEEEESEGFGTDTEAKAFLMSLVLLKMMEKSPF